MRPEAAVAEVHSLSKAFRSCSDIVNAFSLGAEEGARSRAPSKMGHRWKSFQAMPVVPSAGIERLFELVCHWSGLAVWFIIGNEGSIMASGGNAKARC